VSAVIEARGLSKSYGRVRVLDDVSFTVEPGRIVGLIGPNGAGKTTALKTILGLTPYGGHLSVLGHDPYRARDRLMQEVSFIADVATLPRWMRVSQALELMPKIHPRFRIERAKAFLERTEVRSDARVRELSKGMTVQLHLALVMAIDARLLVLDEPTLGLDILYRKAFYEALLQDYFDEERTILVTTHQVEEIEHILTDLMFIQHGRLVLNASMDSVQDSFVEVLIAPERVAEAEQLRPLHRRELFGKKLFLFEGVARERLAALGELHRPSVADLFVAKMKGAPA
jgi:ABC-2 type transport system ATP-binding protein